MATLIGVVSQVVGEVYAVAGDGTRRPLIEGDRVYAGEQLQTGAAGAIAISLSNGGELTLGRDSTLALNEQMLAGDQGNTAADTQETASDAPSDADLTDVQQLQAAIDAGDDPTQVGEATAAGPGAGGAGGAGGVGGGHSFVLLGETAGALNPVIGFPTEGLGAVPEFPEAEPLAAREADSTPSIDIEYEDFEGTIIAGPAIVDEEALSSGSNPDSAAEQASGQLIINSPDGVSSVQIMDFGGTWIDVTNGGTVQGQYGILSVDAAGNWTYTLTSNTFNHGDPNATGAADQVGESFAVRMFDSDGDVSPTVQLNVLVNDDGPSLAEGEGSLVEAIVDEDETANGISDGDADTHAASGGPGTLSALVNFGADGIGSFALSDSATAIGSLESQGLSSGGAALTYSVIGNVLTALAGGETIFTLQVGADGSFTFTLVGPLDHPNLDGDDDELLELPIDFSGVLTAVDGDGDSVGTFNGGSFVVNVEDDVPRLASRGEGEGQEGFPRVVERVHEDALTQGEGAPHNGNPEGGQATTVSGLADSLSALVNFGADGPGNFGLYDNLESMTVQALTSGGDPLTYILLGNVLTASAGGEPIFTLTVNGDGSWKFVLQGPIDHPTPDGAFDTEDLPGLGIDFSGILTATDGDGDPLVGGFPPGSFAVDIEDDVPVLAERGENFQPVGGAVNEDALSSPYNGNDDAAQKLTVTGGEGALHALVSFGADGPGDFGLTNSEAAYESLAALNLTSGGQPLQFSIDPDTGTLTAFVTGTEAGTYDVFTLQVNADGSYSFTLEGPLDHELANGDDGELLGDSGLAIDFSGVLTATDGDGDSLAGSFPPGGFVIDVQDDVPVLAERGDKFEPVGGTVYEDALSSPAPHEGNDDAGQTLTVSGDADSLSSLVNFGADGPGSFGLVDIGAGDDAAAAALLSLTEQGLESGGQPLQFRMDGDVLVGYVGGTGVGSYDVFSLDVNADGSWLFTLLGPIDHPAKNGDDGETLGSSGLAIDFSGVLTATDGDGDPLVGGFTDGSLLIDVQDDVPVLNAGTAVGTTLTVSLEGGSASHSNTYGYYVKDASGHPVSGVIIWANVQEVGAPIQLHGVDPDSIGFFIIPDGATSNKIDGYENGAELTFAEVDGQWQAFLNDKPLIGSDGANVLFDNAALNPNGSSQFTDNGAPGNQNWEDISGGGDGDFNDINIQVDWGRLTVNEDALSGPHNGNDDDPQTLVASGSGETGLLGLVDFGADGPGNFSLVGAAQAQAILEAQGLESGGQPLVYSVEKAFDLDGNLASTALTATAAGSVGGYPVFSLVVSANGDFTFTLRGPLDHPVADGNDDELWGSGDNLGIDFTQLLTATDGDGDPLSIPQGASGLFVVNVEDDVPVLVRGGQIEGNTHVDEDSLVPNGIDDGDGVGAVANGSLSGLVSFGADGPGGFSLLADTDDLPDLTSNGNEVEYDVVGDTLTAFVAGASGYPVFTFTLNSDGNYTFTLKGQIDHPDRNGDDDTDILQVDLSSIVQATDGDGDSVVLHNSVIINVEDDVPDARDNQASTTENTLPPFNLTLIIDSSGSMGDMVSADLDGDGNPENATRLDVAKAALINLINSYVALGVPLNFKIIDFDSGASKVYEGTSAAEAKDEITSLTAGGNTNYDAALDLARDELEDDLVESTLDGYVNRVYFLSDGAPFPSSNDAPAGWQSFVDNNGIDVIAVGIQTPIGGNAESELGEVANDGDTVIIVQDPNELSAALTETVPDPLEGNVLTDAGPGGPGDVDQSGADSPLRLTQFSFVKQAGAEPEVIIVPRGGSASTVTPAGGILTMFSDGHWTYVAPDNVTENIDEIFTYTIVDADGDPDTATLTISVEDGVPLAVNDTASMTEDTDKVSGNVITNDTVGTDSPGAVHFASTTGTYGSLVFNPSGGWTYDLQNSNPAVQGLGVGESLTEIFQYTLTDADGDTSPASLTITITGKDDGVDIQGLNGNDETVRENDLVDGSSPNSGALVQSGTFTVVAPDGLQSLTVHGISVVSGGVVNTFPQPVTTALGNTLTITGFNQLNGVVSYSYTLVDNASHSIGGGENSIQESFVVQATDDDGDTHIASLDVTIIDDVPDAVNDSNASTASESLLTLTGNVLTNDVQGADRVAGGPITAVTLTGTYGTLVLNANGTYTYTLDVADPQFIALGGGGTGTETFTYTHTDADGDSDTARLVLKIRNNDGDVTINGLDIQGQEEILYENDLSQGSSPNASALTQTGTFTISAADGIQTFSLNGANYTLAQLQNSGTTNLLVDSPAGVLRITGYSGTSTGGTVSYSYVLDTRIAHVNAGGENSVLESFSVKVTDVDNDSDTESLDIRIVDDVPNAIDDSNASTASESLLTLTGNVLANDVQGADRVAGGPITATTLAGTYGTLVLNANGSYTYTLNPADPQFVALGGGGTGTETFTYTHKDADGDADTAQLVLNIRNNDGDVTINGLDIQGQEEILYENDLSQGSSPNASALTQTGTFTISAADGIQTFSLNGANYTLAQLQNSGTTNLLVDSPAGVLRITGYTGTSTGGTVSYSYVLDTRIAHANAGGENSVLESFSVKVTDVDNDSDTDSLDIRIVDDVPDAVSDTNASTASESLLTLTGNVLSNDVQGADRVAGGPITAVTLTGTYGTLVLNANGFYTYTLNPADPQFVALPGGATGTETFTYTHTDADGDADTAQLVLNVRNDDQGVTINGLNVQGQEEVVNEDDLPAGSSPNASALTQTGTFDIVAGDGIQTFSVNGSNFTLAQLQNSGASNLVIDSPAGVLRITGFSGSATGGTVSYSYVLDSRVAHANGAGENTVLESFSIQVKDTDGDSDTESLDILIIDDVPAAVDQTVSQQASQSTNTNLLLILDVSGSMNDDAGFGGYTRLEAAKQALLELLEQYDALGNVKVCLVTFSSSATIETGWVDIATAKAELLGLSAGGLTNYEDALLDATTAFAQSGKLTGAQNVAYFLSDGVPNPSSSGINGTEEAAWINFLNGSNNSGPDSGDINAFALGMGPDVSASALNPVAYNGVTNEDTFATIVDDFGQLANTLTATAQASPINGSLVTGGTFGADGGYVLSISVNGVIYTYNPAAGGSISVSGNPNNGTFDTSTNTLTVTMGANGSFAVDMDNGVFTYSPPVSVGSAVNQSIGYVLQDNDGDTASANLNVNISPANGPTIIRDDRVITNAPTVSGNDPILIPKWALLANDTSPSNMLLAITAIGAALDGTLAPLDASASITFRDNDSNGGSFQYTAGGDTALVEVLRDLDGDLNGSYRHDILIGRGDNSDTINGRDGDDILVGLGGADELNGGEGNDILNGGAGNDTLNGGNGNDTASYIDATSAVTVSVNGNNQVTGGAGTDSLINMENLIGSSYGDTLTGDGNANILSGLAGDDTLVGNGGADVLIGGAGNDTMSGGAGEDVFLWNSSDTGTDTILGFTNNYNGNINGDQLNLSQLLMGETTSGGIGNLLSFLDISTINLGGGAALDTVIKISTTAAATPETSTEQTIVLQDVNLFATYGGTEANVILGMLNDGSLKVDVA